MATKTKRRPDVAKTPNPAMRARLIAFAHLYRGGPDELRGNASACYRDLHPTASAATAGAKATAYLHHPIVQEILAEKAAELSDQADITQEQVLREVGRLAFFDIRKLFKDDGTPKGISELDDDTAAAIVGLDAVTIGNKDSGIGTVTKYKLADKKGALELLGKNFKLWTDKVEANVNGGQSLSDLLKQARDESE